ncbi:MAG TPA: M56 family metallopeptidase [Humisphaera sp.]|jgi:beta-lactamase regulating signal transducer with metallopeptidase domain|nr:M56 family metallopeptidase [Humisphaera sp.]
MSLLHSLLESPLIQRLGWTLLHSLWQMTVAGLVLAVALVALRNRAAQARYACACAMMLLVAGMPIVTFLVIKGPALRRDVEPRDVQALAVSDPRSRQAALPENTEAPHRPIMVGGPRENEQFANAPAPKVSTWKSVVPIDRVSRTLPWIVLSWIAGVLAMSVWNFGGWLAVQQLRRLSIKPAGTGADEMLRKLASRLRLHRPIRLMRSALAQTPLVIGVLKPMILVPASLLTDLPPSELESILAHELAHILRQDYLINLLQSVIETLLFHHPAVWWISRQIRIERENCCDDLALSITGDRATYVRALATVAAVRAPMLAPAASGGNLLARLRRIVGTPDAAAPRSSRWIAGVVVGVLLLAGATPRLLSMARAGDEQKTPGANPTADADLVRVRGRVLDPEGKPFAGARVVTAPNWWPIPGDHPAVLSAASSGADGRFEISFKKSQVNLFSAGNGTPGDELWKKLNIAASAAGFGLAWRRFDDVDAQGNVILQLVPDRAIEGRIVDLEAHPVSGMSVTARSMSNRILAASENQFYPPADYLSLTSPLGVLEMPPGVTDADGRFVIRGLGENRWVTLEFHHDQFALGGARIATRQTPPAPPPGSAHPLGSKFELVAAPAISVSGIVRDAGTHKPLAGVGLQSSIDWSRPRPQAITDDQGRYRINGLPRGSVEIAAWSLNEPYVPTFSETPEGAGPGPLTIDFELHKGLWISGKVSSRADGSPVPAMVEYRPLRTNAAIRGIKILQLGWGVSPLNGQTQPDGTYRVVAIPGGGILAARTRDGRYRTGSGFDQIKHPDSDVTASRFNAAREISLPDDATSATADFLLDLGNSLHVSCIDPDGKALAVTAVGFTVDKLTGSAQFASGEFEVTGLSREGSRQLYIVNRDRKLGKAVLLSPEQIAGAKLVVKLEQMASVTGRLINADGDPVRRNLIIASVVDPSAHSESGVLVVESSADGRFTLNLPAGCTFKIQTTTRTAATYATLKKDFSVVSGTTVDLGDVRLKE